ncbi:MAG: hypothetical protein G3M78_09415 [Candidatus Nitrohelix vancouverensis]|uniref:Uncharacterized protein n=1 Tax=Candidatus Nitrohelix vancouverensis TaxID=2705534 RepID=A0A7T0G3R0_9BACT|nr:MAG: hypothetical protein G3M78_09415 [Candidatus Nitrohelix vancouverensis]
MPAHRKLSSNNLHPDIRHVWKRSVLFLFAAIACLSALPVDAQTGNADDKDWVSLGLISYDKKYRIRPGDDFIIFNIQNNASKTITNLYAWIYKYQEDDEGKPGKFLLVNNPHRGGTIINRVPHRPGSRTEWRFPLMRGNAPQDPKGLFTLRASPKSILFAKTEPPRPAQKK